VPADSGTAVAHGFDIAARDAGFGTAVAAILDA